MLPNKNLECPQMSPVFIWSPPRKPMVKLEMTLILPACIPAVRKSGYWNCSIRLKYRSSSSDISQYDHELCRQQTPNGGSQARVAIERRNRSHPQTEHSYKEIMLRTPCNRANR
jgi:hypothetical protein